MMVTKNANTCNFFFIKHFRALTRVVAFINYDISRYLWGEIDEIVEMTG